MSLTRRVLWVLAGGAAVFVAVHIVNHVRMDVGELQRGADRILDQARSLRSLARPEYQELALAGLGRNPHNGPFLRLDMALDRAVVMEAPPEAAGESYIETLEFDAPDAPELMPASGTMGVAATDGALRVITDGEDYLVSARPLAVPRDEVGEILIRARADRGSFMRLAWAGERSGDAASTWLNRLDVRFQDNSGFHTYVVNARNVLKRGLEAGEKLTRLYLQPSDVAGATVEIDFIRFVPKAAAYAAQPHGTGDETIGNELRQVLFMRPDQSLQFAVRVPERSPRLDFGMGALLAAAPLRFEVLIEPADGEVVRAHDATVAQVDHWVDAQVDLEPWAGQDVRLTLRVSAAAGPANVAFWSGAMVSSAPAQPFNVVLMIEDATRADYLSAYGHDARTTPFKDRLMAERGVLFEQAIAQAEKTRPSVASYMTSLYPTATGSWHFSDTLSERYLTLAEVMRAQGYVTASFIQNGNAGPYAGIHQGFDRLLDQTTFGGSTEGILAGEALHAFLRQHRDRNFFLYLHAIDPHSPYDPPEPYRGEFGGRAGSASTGVSRNPEFDPAWVEHPSRDSRRRYYEAEIAHNDAVVARFFAMLEELGLAEHTLVVMTSDHGEYLGERGVLGDQLWSHNPPGYLIGTRVPLMMVYPARLPTPKRIAERVQLLDLMPTILDLAGVDSTGLMLQGEALTDLIEGRRLDHWRERVIVSEEPSGFSKSDPCACGSVYFGDWHVLSSIWLAKPVRRFAPQLVSFLATATFAVDPRAPADELTWSMLPDLGVRWRQRALLADLRQTNMETWRMLTSGSGNAPEIDPDTLERLKGLGYIN